MIIGATSTTGATVQPTLAPFNFLSLDFCQFFCHLSLPFCLWRRLRLMMFVTRKRYLTLISFGWVLIIIYWFYIYRGSRPVILVERHHVIFENKKTEDILPKNINHASATIVDTYHVSSEDIKESEMHLITNYPLMTETPWIEGQTETEKSRLGERQLEIEEVLQRNLNNTLVTTVHLLVNQPSAEQRLRELSFHNKHKIIVRRIETLPKYKDFFVYVNEKLLNRLVVMLNMDIYIGEGFELLNKTFFVKSNISYALTRHHLRHERRCDMSGRFGSCRPGFGASLDAYIFVLTRRVNESVLSELDYDSNVIRAENRLVWVLRHRLNKKLLNPCQILRTYHSHCINIHGRSRPKLKGNLETVRMSGLYN